MQASAPEAMNFADEPEHIKQMYGVEPGLQRGPVLGLEQAARLVWRQPDDQVVPVHPAAHVQREHERHPAEHSLLLDVIAAAEETVYTENFKREMMATKKYRSRDIYPSLSPELARLFEEWKKTHPKQGVKPNNRGAK